MNATVIDIAIVTKSTSIITLQNY